MTETSSSTPGSQQPMQVLENLGKVIAPATLLSSVMLYFGWVRTAALFNYFGVDPAILGFSVQDYALRTVGVAFQPAIFLLLAILVASIFVWVADWMRKTLSCYSIKLKGISRLSLVTLVEFAVGILLLWSSIQIVFAFDDVFGVARAIGLLDPLHAAIALSASAFILTDATRHLTDGSGQWRTRTARLVNGISIATIIVGLFWATAVTAQDSGERLARFINEQPSAQARVTIISKRPLDLLRSNADLTFRGSEGEPSFRYVDLRLLIYSNSRWILLTRDRSESGRLKAAIIRDADDIGVQVERT